MVVYTSRYSNPQLKIGNYIPVRISVGTPKYNLGYKLAGAIEELAPFGIFNKFTRKEDYRREYFKRLDRFGIKHILEKLKQFETAGRDIVLLCYEDIRKSPDDWCHRTMFAEWLMKNSSNTAVELNDPTPDPLSNKTKSKGIQGQIPHNIQLSLF